MKPIYLFAFLALTGCATSFETHPYDASKDAGSIDGVIYYQPAVMRVTTSYTVRTDKDGAILGSVGDGTCRAIVQKEELQVLPDYVHPRVFLNTSSPLSSGKVGVSMSNGMITSVNLENSPPVTGVATPVGTVVAAAVTKLAASPEVTALPACNAGPAITAVVAL